MVSDIKFLSFLMDFCRSCNTLKPEGVVYQCTNLLTWNLNVKRREKEKEKKKKEKRKKKKRKKVEFRGFFYSPS
jgi:hypothetical protein